MKKQTNVKKFGEVFTPPALVKEMLDTLPDEVFDGTKTVLDPCAGATCIFPIFFIIKGVRLFGKSALPGLVKNMYSSELNPNAIEWAELIFQTYINMLKDTDPNDVEALYIANFNKIVADYHQYEKDLLEEF